MFIPNLTPVHFRFLLEIRTPKLLPLFSYASSNSQQRALSSVTLLRYCASEKTLNDSPATRGSPHILSPAMQVRRQWNGVEVVSGTPLIVEHCLCVPHPSRVSACRRNNTSSSPEVAPSGPAVFRVRQVKPLIPACISQSA